MFFWAGRSARIRGRRARKNACVLGGNTTIWRTSDTRAGIIRFLKCWQFLLRRLFQGGGHRVRLGPDHQRLRPAQGQAVRHRVPRDDDAEELWQKVTGIPKSRIFRLDEKDNFWQMGETGPCGPCSEIHYDLGAEAAEPGRSTRNFPATRADGSWNLEPVFMQYDRDTSGKLTPLPRPSIDTGMGWSALPPCCKARFPITTRI